MSLHQPDATCVGRKAGALRLSSAPRVSCMRMLWRARWRRGLRDRAVPVRRRARCRPWAASAWMHRRNALIRAGR